MHNPPPVIPPAMAQALLTEVSERGAAVPEVTWCVPGEDAAVAALDGPEGFLTAARLGLYEAQRNNPGVGNVGGAGWQQHWACCRQ